MPIFTNEHNPKKGAIMNNKEKITQALNTLYNEVFNNGKAHLLPELVSGPYIQHNPLFSNGIEPLMGYINNEGKLANEVKRMAIDDNLAFIHVYYPNWAGKEYAAIDIFRFNDAGKIVEHWDVMQLVPDKAANDNSMF